MNTKFKVLMVLSLTVEKVCFFTYSAKLFDHFQTGKMENNISSIPHN
ncbi:unnamed protein product [marine sediment metagenome]|uniref:Uncharacterized protein n=1 Tax=marine sediment metagenome TaxID=412755 RepID=X1MEN7_9ZZZZ